MGIRSLGPAPRSVDDDRQLARKRELLEQAHDVVVASAPGPRRPWARRPLLVASAAGRPLEAGSPPLEAAALLGPGGPVCPAPPGRGLAAGRWRGLLPVHVAHRRQARAGGHRRARAPCPPIAEELAGRVDRLLDRLTPARPVWRRNWFVHDTPELHLPEPPPPHPAPVAPDDLWLRSERQTLRRLPASGAILFTIRTELAPLSVVAGRPALAAGLARAIRSWSGDLVAYRGAAGWRDGVLTWLDGLPGRPPAASRES